MANNVQSITCHTGCSKTTASIATATALTVASKLATKLSRSTNFLKSPSLPSSLTRVAAVKDCMPALPAILAIRGTASAML